MQETRRVQRLAQPQRPRNSRCNNLGKTINYFNMICKACLIITSVGICSNIYTGNEIEFPTYPFSPCQGFSVQTPFNISDISKFDFYFIGEIHNFDDKIESHQCATILANNRISIAYLEGWNAGKIVNCSSSVAGLPNLPQGSHCEGWDDMNAQDAMNEFIIDRKKAVDRAHIYYTILEFRDSVPQLNLSDKEYKQKLTLYGSILRQDKVVGHIVDEAIKYLLQEHEEKKIPFQKLYKNLHRDFKRYSNGGDASKLGSNYELYKLNYKRNQALFKTVEKHIEEQNEKAGIYIAGQAHFINTGHNDIGASAYIREKLSQLKNKTFAIFVFDKDVPSYTRYTTPILRIFSPVLKLFSSVFKFI